MMFSTPGVIQQTVLPNYPDTLPSGGVLVAYTNSGLNYNDDFVVTSWSATVNNSATITNLTSFNTSTTVAFIDGPSGYGKIPCMQLAADSNIKFNAATGEFYYGSIPPTFIVFYPETTDDNTKRRLMSFNTSKTGGIYGTLNSGDLTYGCYRKTGTGFIVNDFNVTDVSPTQNNTGVEALYVRSYDSAAVNTNNRKLHIFSSDQAYSLSTANNGGDASGGFGFFKGSSDVYEVQRDVMPMKVLEVIIGRYDITLPQVQAIYDYLYAKWGYLGVPQRTAT